MLLLIGGNVEPHTQTADLLFAMTSAFSDIVENLCGCNLERQATA